MVCIRGRDWKRRDLLIYRCRMSCSSLLPQTQPEHTKHSTCCAHSTHISTSLEISFRTEKIISQR